MRETGSAGTSPVRGSTGSLVKRLLAFGLASFLVATAVPGPAVQAGHLEEACGEALEPSICEPIGTAQELCEEILPEVCDPWTEQAKLTASDGAEEDYFAPSVALDGDTAIIGAVSADVDGNTKQGAAYVYKHDGTAWAERAKLTASDGSAGDGFGSSVALDGDTAIIGARAADPDGNMNQGTAYVYEHDGTGWIEQAKVTAGDGAEGDFFGGSVALDGDTAFIGADLGDVDGNASQGAVYVYDRAGTAWTEQVKITASDGAEGDHFGGSIALDDDTALIGADLGDVDGNMRQGAVYVYERAGTGWIEYAKLTASDGAAGDLFGVVVALDGDTALIGAQWADVDENGLQGAAYAYERVGTDWLEQAKLTASDGDRLDVFGSSVALDGDTAIIGAVSADVDGNTKQGAAYAYKHDGTAWAERAKLTASDGSAGDRFGSSVALDRDTALIGVPWADVDGNGFQGAAYVYQNEMGLL